MAEQPGRPKAEPGPSAGGNGRGAAQVRLARERTADAAERWFAELLEEERARWRRRLAAEQGRHHDAMKQERKLREELERRSAEFESTARQLVGRLNERIALLEGRLGARGGLPDTSSRPAATDIKPDTDGVNLSTATFDELRSIGMSVTQANRVLRYRDAGELTSLEDLAAVPGFPRSFLSELMPLIRYE